MTEQERETARRHLQRRVAAAPTKKKIQWRLGRRGAFLVLMGTLYLCLAYLYGFKEHPDYVYRQLAFPVQVGHFLGFDTPEDAMVLWGWLWSAAGLTAVVTAWWPPGKDSLGFAGLWVFSATWASLNIYGAILPQVDSERSFVTGVLFAVYAATIVIVSGMPDASPISKVSADDD